MVQSLGFDMIQWYGADPAVTFVCDVIDLVKFKWFDQTETEGVSHEISHWGIDDLNEQPAQEDRERAEQVTEMSKIVGIWGKARGKKYEVSNPWDPIGVFSNPVCRFCRSLLNPVWWVERL